MEEFVTYISNVYVFNQKIVLQVKANLIPKYF